MTVVRWTLSDVPVAVSLSGGLDSSSVAFWRRRGRRAAADIARLRVAGGLVSA